MLNRMVRLPSPRLPKPLNCPSSSATFGLALGYFGAGKSKTQFWRLIARVTWSFFMGTSILLIAILAFISIVTPSGCQPRSSSTVIRAINGVAYHLANEPRLPILRVSGTFCTCSRRWVGAAPGMLIGCPCLIIFPISEAIFYLTTRSVIETRKSVH